MCGRIEGHSLFWDVHPTTAVHSPAEASEFLCSQLAYFRLKKLHSTALSRSSSVSSLSVDLMSFSIVVSPVVYSTFFPITHNTYQVRIHAICGHRSVRIGLFDGCQTMRKDDITEGVCRWDSLGGKSDFEKLIYLLFYSRRRHHVNG
jgi:hypothetical protein